MTSAREVTRSPLRLVTPVLDPLAVSYSNICYMLLLVINNTTNTILARCYWHLELNMCQMV